MMAGKSVIAYLVLLSLAAAVWADCDYDYDDGCETEAPSCDLASCLLPNCSCFGLQPEVPVRDRPQFVMLTFDDAVTVANIDTYRKIASTRRNKRNGRPIGMTFFVCHEYNDYQLTRELYSQGHEIAVHSISHESNTDLWRYASASKWKSEMSGLRIMLRTFGYLPPTEIVGHRAPFLQTAGDVTFDVLKKEGFLYDSSMPTRNFMDPPIWPYTLDYGYAPQDCQIEPCPRATYPGVWEVPMVQYQLESKEGTFYCSMADACTPQPETRAETKDYLMSNFLRHYQTNKAPFPVFLHEAWLREPARLSGYLDFLDDILQKDDVFLVTIRDVIEYMKKPIRYQSLNTRVRSEAGDCPDAKACSYTEPLRNMKSCAPCPRFYPWVGTPLGKRKPNFPDPDED